MIFKRTISAALIVMLFFHFTLPLFASEPTPTPDHEATSEAIIESNVTHEGSNSATFTLNPEATTEGGITNSGNASEIVTTDNTVSNVNINNDNHFNGTITASDSASTGNNTADKNISLNGAIEVKSGDASIIKNLQNIINTNIIGSNAFVSLLNVFDTTNSNIDLSYIRPCQQNGQITASDVPTTENSGNNVTILNDKTDRTLFNVKNKNVTDLTNVVNAQAVTGGNTAVENVAQGTRVETGSASVNVNLFNMANTNLVGNCFYFGVINLFGEFKGNIILPYEMDIINNRDSSSSSSINFSNTDNDVNATTSATVNNILAAKNNNSASVSTVINTDANTGKNTLSDTINFSEGGEIVTGKSNVVTNMLDIVNTNIVGGRFIVIQINKLSEWIGSVVGQLETYIVEPKYLLLYEKGNQTENAGHNVDSLSQQDLLSMLSVTNDNTATVENTLNLTANTGDNTAGRFNANIKTGSADIHADVFNMVNTNIIGNNWMYVMINIFDKFTGKVVLSRADLAITKSTTAHEVQKEDMIAYQIHVENNGQIPAESVGIDDQLPSGMELVSASANPEVNGSNLTWRLGTIPAHQNRNIVVNVRIRDNIDGTPIVNKASAFTSTAESNIDNNSSSSTIYYKNRPVPQQLSQSSSSSSGQGSSNNSGSSINNNGQPVVVRVNKFTPFKKVVGKNKVIKKPVKITKKSSKKVQKPVKKSLLNSLKKIKGKKKISS